MDRNLICEIPGSSPLAQPRNDKKMFRWLKQKTKIKNNKKVCKNKKVS